MTNAKNIHVLFPTVLYVKDNFLNQEQQKRLFNFFKNTPFKKGGKEWNTDVFNTHGTFDLREDKVANFLPKLVTKEVNDFKNIFAIKPEFKCIGSWINYYKKNDYQEWHLHGDCDFSAIYFVNVLENSSPVLFENPSLGEHLNPLESFKSTEFNMLTESVSAETNRLIIFKSYLKHMVPKNDSNRRLTIAMNFKKNENRVS